MAEEVIRHETGENVVMNCAVRGNGAHSYLVAGQESHCQLYHVNFKIDSCDSSTKNGRIETLKPLLGRKSSALLDEHSTNVRNRRASKTTTETNASKSNGATDTNQNENRCIRFDIKAGDLTQTDFSTDGPLQRVVRISANCKFMATGGTDAHIRIWRFPNMMKTHDINFHTKEVDDLDFSPDSKQLVSIAKDGLAVVWNVDSGKQIAQLTWTPPDNVKYLFKRCRFGVYEGKRGQHRLFTITNPLGKVGQQVRR